MGEIQTTRSRGYLPHIDAPGADQFITFRLADSLPREVLQEWERELQHLPAIDRKREFNSRTEKFLDAGFGSQLLANPVAANIVVDALLFAHQKSCTLYAFAVMPTHVHIAVRTSEQNPWPKVIGRLKGYTALRINQTLGLGEGRLWQPESFDKVIRDSDHLLRVVEYIEWNPVKAGLCRDPKAWPYSSANAHMRERLARGTAT